MGIYSVEAERAVLGALLLEPGLLARAESMLVPEDFHRWQHRAIYAAMLAAGPQLDVTILAAEMERRGELEAAGGVAYLAELLGELPTAAHFGHYAREVVDAANRRRLMAAADAVGELAESGGHSAAEVLEQAEAMLGAVSARVASERPATPFHEALSAYWDELADELSGGTVRIPFGFRDLDRLMGGLKAGDLCYIGGRPSMGKCLGAGTKVVMADGSLVAAEDVRTGDLLLGPDSKPRQVLSVTDGIGDMYWVRQTFGISYRVNGDHLLALKRSKNEKLRQHGEMRYVTARKAANKGVGWRGRWKGYKTAVDWPEKAVPLDPYFIGLWLGDGAEDNARVYTVEPEIVAYLRWLAQVRGDELHITDEDRCPGYLVSGGRKQAARDSSVQAILRGAGLLGSKHIPQAYLVNSKANRLRLLAGLVDSDGNYQGGQNGPYEVVQKRRQLAGQVKLLCDSLGYRTSLGCKVVDGVQYWRVRFNGNVDEIPVLVERKRARPWADFRDWSLSGIRIEPDGLGQYYGFELDGDGLFLLEDMTVTHNTTLVLQQALNLGRLGIGPVVMFSVESTEAELAGRILGYATGMPSHLLRRGRASPDELTWVAQVAGGLELPLLLREDYDLTPAGIDAALAVVARGGPIRLVIVDHVHRMEPGARRFEGRRQEIGYISRRLKALAQKYAVPVVAICTLSRGVDDRRPPKPMLGDLRETGDLEHDADVVLLMYWDGYYDEDSPRKFVTEVVVAKHRDGPTGSVWLRRSGQGVLGDLVQVVEGL